MIRLEHRGPDWSGLYQNGGCFLAHQRLAIVDPAFGDQPLYSEDKAIVVTVMEFLLIDFEFCLLFDCLKLGFNACVDCVEICNSFDRCCFYAVMLKFLLIVLEF